MAFSDWYEVIDIQASDGQQVLNVYHVQKVNPAFDANEVALAYSNTVFPKILLIQPVNVVHTSVTVRSLDDPLDFAGISITPNVGTLAGTGLSTFNAATIQFTRLRTDMKNGQKRWIGGVEESINRNLWNASFITLLTDLATAVVSAWETSASPGIPVCTFGILKRICTTSPSPPCVGGYRLPESDAELVFYTPATFTVRDRVRSQVSRKLLV